MNETEILADEIFKRYGAITRARGCFLYTKKTVRLTDLYQEGGRAILGWGGSSAFTMLKNTLNRGITGSFFTELHPQLAKAVSMLLDNQKSTRTVYVFNSLEEAKAAAKDACVFTPFDPDKTDYATKDAVIIAPPLPYSSTTVLLAINSQGQLLTEKAKSVLTIPSPMIAGICRSIYDLIKAEKEREEKDFYLYDPVLTKYWVRKGCYLFPKVPKEQYHDFMLHCLDCAVVISPNYDVPSLVPFGADRGVFTALKNKPFREQ